MVGGVSFVLWKGGVYFCIGVSVQCSLVFIVQLCVYYLER